MAIGETGGYLSDNTAWGEGRGLVTALELVGITADPATRTLKRLPAIPLK